MIEFRADLHCHTTCSDGTYAPTELLLLAKEIGLSGIAITDHDTIEAYPTAIPKAQELGIALISGVEFSSVLYGESVHILGYAFDWRHQAIEQLCEKHVERRSDRNGEILDLLKQEGMEITHEDVKIMAGKDFHTLGRPHIALAMVQKGYVQSVEEAFKKYLGEKSPCFARGKPISLEETTHAIRSAHGLVVIAHPHLIKDPHVLRSLLKLPFDGMECHYSRFYPHQEKRWLDIAKSKKWLITGGSDFHGAVKPTIPLGCSWVPEETFKYLQEHYRQAMGHDERS